jgi:hypothetical protein
MEHFAVTSKFQVTSNVVSCTFVESSNISPVPISGLLFAQPSGSSGITAEGEGCPVIEIKDHVRGELRRFCHLCVYSQQNKTC